MKGENTMKREGIETYRRKHEKAEELIQLNVSIPTSLYKRLAALTFMRTQSLCHMVREILVAECDRAETQ